MNEVTEVEVIQSDGKDTSLYLLTKAEIDTQISTAKAFPRSLKKFRDRALSMATLNEDIAASCNYTVPRGGSSISGKSIRLAEITLAAYGNVRSGARVVFNDGKTITAQGICHDLETNSCVTKEVSRSIVDKKGKPYSLDMQIMTGNAASSIALRNAVFACIPSALTDDIYDESKKVARGTAATLLARVGKAVEYFKSIKVTEKQLCDVLGIQKIEDIDLDKLDTLTGFKSAIKNGEASAKDIFEPTNNEPTIELIEELYHAKIDKLHEKEKSDCIRIIQNKETASYNKLFKMLSAK